MFHNTIFATALVYLLLHCATVGATLDIHISEEVSTVLVKRQKNSLTSTTVPAASRPAIAYSGAAEGQNITATGSLTADASIIATGATSNLNGSTGATGSTNATGSANSTSSTNN
ncbi:hypothetical protein CROQUDRAFT_134806 [Cronartium quercuum f. sp. fusiforme G11]|uniref:Uncharacterized protein n=1 Tax=Cronartium quercuum f. sp. fusiforme G11 TaxID=708437 RepID=A0A9P6NGV4_9BASI|nr:hypothetical protein CROQUDRAFT_134806 [Cronartium quercuum f. sp. fusiforme G11]